MENSFGKNIIPENESERLDALRKYRILDTPPEDAFDYIARLATKIFNVPVSLVSLVDKDEVFFKANVGMEGTRTNSRGVSLCSLAVLNPEVTIFENVPEDPCLLTNPNVIGEFGLKFYAGAPLITGDGYEIGTVCVIDKNPRAFTAKEQEVLKELAQMVMHELELRLAALKKIDEYKELTEELATANEEIRAANEELSSVIEELRQSDESLQETNSDLENRVSQRTVELENSENTLLRLIMNAKYSLAILRGEDWIIEIANKAIAAIWNKSLPDVIGKPLLEVLPEIVNQPFPELLRQVYQKGISYQQDEEIFLSVNAAGTTTKYISFAYDPLFGKNNQVVGIIVSADDITDKVSTREHLKASLSEQQSLNEELSALNEEMTSSNERLGDTQIMLETVLDGVVESEIKFRNIIDQAPVAIAIFDGPDFVIDVYNDKVLEYWGRTAAEVKNKPLFVALPEASGQGFEELLTNVLTTGERFVANELPVTLMRKGILETTWINFIYDPIRNIQGKITGIIVVCNEVTDQVNARKQLEEAYEQTRLAKEAAQLGTFDYNLEKGLLEWDDRCRILFGVSHRQPVTYEKDFLLGLHEDDRDRVAKYVSEILGQPDGSGDVDMEYRTVGAEDRKLRWIKAKGRVFFNPGGKPVRLIGSVVDITEQKENDLRKSDFIGMVSHELKTPLTSLTAIIQVTQAKLAKSEDKFLKDAMNKASVQVKRMSNMINGFLNVSRLESGKILIEKTTFDLSELIAETVRETELTSPSHQIHLDIRRSFMVNADKDKIGSVVSNLIGNAVKYSPKDTTITIICDVKAKNALVSIRDQGMGINREDQAKLFERYYRASGKNMNHISGFGIGLYLSSEIVLRHRGKIWVESEPDRGSIFYFTLPLVNE